MRLALFDLDHTLLPLDSDHAWGQYTVRLGWRDPVAFAQANDLFYERYKAGTLDIAEYIRFATEALRERSADELATAHNGFMADVIRPAIRPAALDLLARHRAAGDEVVIVTATNAFVTGPIATALGVEHLIAIDLARDAQGALTGGIAGAPSFRDGKVRRVEQWLADRGYRWADLAHTAFYSDSINDLALLERVQEPVATNPDPRLSAIAQERGWRILNLFHDQKTD